MSRGISGGKQVIKFANTSNRGRVCLFSQNKLAILVTQNEQFDYTDKLYVIIACCEDIYVRLCMQKK